MLFLQVLYFATLKVHTSHSTLHSTIDPIFDLSTIPHALISPPSIPQPRRRQVTVSDLKRSELEINSGYHYLVVSTPSLTSNYFVKVFS
ncbi:hypothetical protein M501DRAFT_995808 [Patellaria atrata CBS 101060]|uniref:Uncharacterized protein n=1 Tax=Patellaria atrata CBS 101060 TaxID=1346257 RepID=A0A9P4S8K4_9PEZI|nr:hypothetical protein M501DRAFT_995808 [Patellaria atrata CBS 101060]